MLTKNMLVAAVSLLTLASPASAARIANRTALDILLGANQSLEDFERLAIRSQYLVLDPLDAQTNLSGIGPNRIAEGIRFSSLYGEGVYINPNGYYGLVSQTLTGGGDNPFSGYRISFTKPVNAFGMDLQAYAGFPSSAAVRVYDLAGSLLYSATGISGGANGALGFFGFGDANGIGRVEIDESPGSYTMIDNIGFGMSVAAPVPEPAAWTTMLIGFALIGGVARYRRRATRIALT